jgi:hypothetical protein
MAAGSTGVQQRGNETRQQPVQDLVATRQHRVVLMGLRHAPAEGRLIRKNVAFDQRDAVNVASENVSG